MWTLIWILLCLAGCSAVKPSGPVNTHSKASTSTPINGALSQAEVGALSEKLWTEYVAHAQKTRASEHETRTLIHDQYQMPFWYKVFGAEPESGRRMFISLHGGGGAPPHVNDRQYENQKQLYTLEEGVYFVPRAPTNTWDLWHQAHIDPLLQRAIEHMVLFESVDPNKVYLMGYSAGGDGVYQVAPRMADTFAAAAMMAGHPNETQPHGLRNLPWTIHMGEHDTGYGRNKTAIRWKEWLGELRDSDPEGYRHNVTIHEGMGHWMDGKDSIAIPWMARHSRVQVPTRVVWQQDDVTRNHFYWLAVRPEHIKARARIVAHRKGQLFTIEHSDVSELMIRLRDDMVDFTQPITVRHNNQIVFEGHVRRSAETVRKTFQERHDPTYVFSAEVVVSLTP